jgi:hypothetical protein
MKEYSSLKRRTILGKLTSGGSVTPPGNVAESAAEGCAEVARSCDLPWSQSVPDLNWGRYRATSGREVETFRVALCWAGSAAGG